MLRIQKTIAYEIGLTEQILQDYRMEITGFFKDIRAQIHLQTVINKLGESLNTYVNRDIANPRGFEVTLRRFFRGWWGGRVSYTYSFTKGTSSSPRRDSAGRAGGYLQDTDYEDKDDLAIKINNLFENKQLQECFGLASDHLVQDHINVQHMVETIAQAIRLSALQ